MDALRWHSLPADHRRAQGIGQRLETLVLLCETIPPSPISPDAYPAAGVFIDQASRPGNFNATCLNAGMKDIEGDLLQLALAGHFDVIVHGCNCQCIMGTGIAKAIKLQFPQAFAADQATATGDRSKLGSYSSALAHNALGQPFTVVNAYTQWHWRGAGEDRSRRAFPAGLCSTPAPGGSRTAGGWD